jgi:formyltetrahydrofolate hydrolase
MENVSGPIVSNEADRVQLSTATSSIENIGRKMEERVRSYAKRKGDISDRLVGL